MEYHGSIGITMPWRSARRVPFTRIDVAGDVPAEAGVFAVIDGDRCLLVSSTWNLKGRLLELLNSTAGLEPLDLVFELLPEAQHTGRVQELTAVLMPAEPQLHPSGHPQLPGLHLSGAKARHA